jgi:hypothetical protein
MFTVAFSNLLTMTTIYLTQVLFMCFINSPDGRLTSLQAKAVDRFAKGFFSGCPESGVGVEVLGLGVFGMDGQLDALTGGMYFLHLIDKQTDCAFPITLTLITLVNEKMIYPVIIGTVRFKGKFHKTYHMSIGVDSIRPPDQPKRPDIGFGQSDKGNGGIFSDESLLMWLNQQGQSLTPVLACNFLKGNYGHIR